MPTSRKVGVAEAAKILDVDARVIVELVTSRKLRPIRTKKTSELLFREKELWDYLARRSLLSEKDIHRRVMALETEVASLKRQLADVIALANRTSGYRQTSRLHPMEVHPERVRLLLGRIHPNLFT